MNSFVLRVAVLAAIFVWTGAAMPAAPRDKWLGQSALRPIQAPMPAFPDRMLREGYHHGTVHLLLEIDPTGEVVDHLVVAETTPVFGAAAEAAVKKWRFHPPGAVHIVDLTLNFETRGVVVVVKRADHPEDQERTVVSLTCPAHRLDRRLKPVNVVAPLYPEQLAKQGTVGAVTVNYYIDQQGRVRMPVTAEQDHPLLSGLAIAAVREWRFEPPTCDGEPTLVRASQTFRFGEVAANGSGGGGAGTG